jgi:SOS-response transcriptional repressor LexA
MNIGEKLAALRNENGFTQPQVAEYLTSYGFEITQRGISKWERGFTSPNSEQFLLLCRLYKVRDVLSTFLDIPDTLASLNNQGRRRVEEYIRLLSADEMFATKKKELPVRLLRTIPLYDLPVSAGTGQFLVSSDYELIEGDETVPLSATFAVRISGDSMLPRFVDRQIVYVKQQQTLDNGEVGIFILNGNAYCKQLAGDSPAELRSINGKYLPIPIAEYDEFRVLGKVVG